MVKIEIEEESKNVEEISGIYRKESETTKEYLERVGDELGINKNLTSEATDAILEYLFGPSDILINDSEVKKFISKIEKSEKISGQTESEPQNENTNYVDTTDDVGHTNNINEQTEQNHDRSTHVAGEGRSETTTTDEDSSENGSETTITDEDLSENRSETITTDNDEYSNRANKYKRTIQSNNRQAVTNIHIPSSITDNFQFLNKRNSSLLEFATAKRANYLILIAAIVLYIYHSSFFWGWIVDDAGISFGFAKNIANGYGAVLNPGSEPVEAYSNPLWVAIIAILIKIDGFDPYITTNILATILGSGNIIITYLLTRELFSTDGRYLDALPAIFLTFSTSFVAWSFSGLETPMYSLLLVSATYAYVLEIKNKIDYPISGVLLFLAAVTRPEGFGFFILAAFHRGIYTIKNEITKTDLIWFVSFLIPFGIYHWWHYSYFKFLLPNTFYFKVGGGLWGRINGGYRYLKPFFTEYGMWLLIPLLPAIFINSLKEYEPTVNNNLYSRSIVLFMLVGGLVYTLYTGGDWMMELRFLAPIFPFAFILIYVGIREVMEIQIIRSKNIQFMSSVVVLILVFGILIQPAFAFTPAASSNPTISLNNVQDNENRFDSRANRAAISSDASLITPDLGAHAYYHNLRYVDLAGLADITIGHNSYAPGIFREHIFKDKKPTFVLTHGPWSRNSRIKGYPEFKQDYTSIGGSQTDFVRKDIFQSHDTNPSTDSRVDISNIEFLGYTEQNKVIPIGGEIHYTGYWRLTEEANKKYHTKTTISKNGDVIKKYERGMMYGWFPTDNWKLNQTYLEHYKFDIPSSLESGRYNISISLESESISRTVINDDIVVGNESATEMAERKYELAMSTDDMKEKKQLAKRAYELRSNNETYRKAVKKYTKNYYYNIISSAHDSYKNGNIDDAFNKINQVGSKLLNNETAQRVRHKVSNHYLSEANVAKGSGEIKKAYDLYKKAAKADPGNMAAIKQRTKMQTQHQNELFYRVEDVPDSASKTNVKFGEKMTLVGYNIPSDNINPDRAGSPIIVDYYLRCEQNMEKNYRIFSHHESSNLGRYQGDHDIRYPTSQCSPGDIIKTTAMPSPPQVSQEESVALKMGIWHRNSGERLQASSDSISIDNNDRVELANYDLLPR